MYKDKFVNYHLYGERSRPIPADFTHVESYDSIIRRYGDCIKPHLHTLLVHILCVKEGKMTMILTKKEVEVSGPSIVIIPANIVHGFDYYNPKGWAFSLSSIFVEELLKPLPSFQLDLNKVHVISGMQEDQAFERLFYTAENLVQELESEQAGKSMVLQSGFQLLIVASLRAMHRQENKSFSQDDRKLKYYRDFLSLIKEKLLSDTSITEYAQKLRITTIHLNRICQAVAGKSALHVIQDHLIQQAIKYLNNTDYSVSEISYMLNVKDPSYFSRLFKKHIGVSPKDYRNNKQQPVFEKKVNAIQQY